MKNSNLNYQENKSNSTKIVLSLLGVLVVLIAVLIFTFFKNSSKQINTILDTVKTDKTVSSEVNSTSSDSQLKQRELDLKEQELRLKEKELDQRKRGETSTQTKPQNQWSSTPGRYPEASERYLSSAEIQYMSKSELELMRNEIFARHGYIFTKNEKMIRYFNSQSWYSPTSYDVNNLLSKIEKENVALIKMYER